VDIGILGGLHLLIVNGLQYSGRRSTPQAVTASRVRGWTLKTNSIIWRLVVAAVARLMSNDRA